MSDVEKGTGEGRHFRFGITMSETSEKPETLPVAAAPGCCPEEGGRGEGGEEETSENGRGGAVAVGALDATPPSALSPVAEEPTGDTKKKSKPAGGGKITCRAGRGSGSGKLAVVDTAAFFHLPSFLLIAPLSAL